MASRMKERYVAEIAPALNKKFGYKSVMQIHLQGHRHHHRPEAHHLQGPQERGKLQGA